MDFETQRRAVSAINRFAGRHKLLIPACAAAKAVTVGFCATVRFFDMALSDSEGRFLGKENAPKAKVRDFTLPEDKEKPVRTVPFAKRAAAAGIAVCFMTMILPPELAVFASAAGAELTVSSGVVRGLSNGDYLTYKNPADISARLFSGKDAYSIADDAFSGCTGIASVDLISSGINDIGNSAFASMPSLSEIHISAADNINIGNGAFSGAAPDSVIFVRGCDSKEDFESFKARLAGKYSPDRTRIVNDRNKEFSLSVPDDVKNVRARPYTDGVLISFKRAEGADGYGIYLFSESEKRFVKLLDTDDTDDLGEYIGAAVPSDILGKYAADRPLFAVKAYKRAVSYVTAENIYSTHFAVSDRGTSAADRLTPDEPDLSLSVNGNRVSATWSRQLEKMMSATVSEADYYKLYIGSDYDSCEFSGVYDSAQMKLPLDRKIQDCSGYTVVLRAFFDPFRLAENDNSFFGAGQIYDPDIPWVTYTESVRTTGGIALDDPTGLSCDLSYTEDRVLLSWNEVSGADGYLISVSGISEPLASSDVGNSTSYDLPKAQITSGSGIDFSVQAYTGSKGKYSALSSEVSFGARSEEYSIGGFSAVPADGGVMLSWNAFEGASFYSVSCFSGNTVIESKSTADTSVTFSGLENGREYRFEITADNAPVDGALASVSAVPDGTAYDLAEDEDMDSFDIKDSVLGVSRLKGTKLSSTGFFSATPNPAPSTSSTQIRSCVVLAWQTVANADKYEIHRIDQRTGDDIVLDTVSETYFTDWKVTNGVTYTYYIISLPAAGSDYERSDPSAKRDATVSDYDRVASPVDLTVSSGEKDIGISWVSNDSNAVRFELHRVDSRNNSDTVIADTAETFYTDRTAQAGVTYTYYVIACPAAGSGLKNSGESLRKSGRLKEADSLAAPVDLILSPSDSQIDVFWSPNDSRAVRYELHRIDNRTGTDIVLTDTTALAYTDTGVSQGVTYTYYVIACPAAGSGLRNSNESLRKSAKLKDIERLAAPLNLTVASGESQIDISWLNNDKRAVRYEVHRIDTRTGAEAVIADTTDTRYTDRSVTAGVTYTYYVIACSAPGSGLGNSVESLRRSCSVNDRNNPTVDKPDSPRTLEAPRNFSATPGDAQVSLSWAAVKGASHYLLYRRDMRNNLENIAADITDTKYTDKDVINGVTYSYYVVAVPDNGSGLFVSGKSLERTATPQPPAQTTTVTTSRNQQNNNTTTTTAPRQQGGNTTSQTTAAKTNPPAAPLDFSVTAGDGKATLAWTAVQGAKGYQACIVNSKGVIVPLAEVSKPGAVHDGLTNGNIYTYTVRAYTEDSNGYRVYGPYSIQKTITAGSTFSAPIDLTAKPGDSQIDLMWTAVKDAEGYVVYSYDSLEASFKPVSVVSKPGFNHTGLTNGHTYTYMVSAYKHVGGQEEYSDYSIAVSAAPSASGQPVTGNSGYRINVVGTTPYGLSDTELITADSDGGAFNTDVDVRFGADRESERAVKNVLKHYAGGLKNFDIYPFDIDLFISGTFEHIEPAEGHSVSIIMPIPDRMKKYGEDFQLAHITSDEKLEIIPLSFVSYTDDLMLVKFQCTSFSPFAFVHYYSAEDLATRAGTDASGTAASGSSAYAMRCGGARSGYMFRRKNKIYKRLGAPSGSGVQPLSRR